MEEHIRQVRTIDAGGVRSRANAAEARRATALANALAEGAGENSVAILTWYNAQVLLLFRKELQTEIHQMRSTGHLIGVSQKYAPAKQQWPDENYWKNKQKLLAEVRMQLGG